MPGLDNPLGGATGRAVNGVATFANLSIQKAGNRYAVTAYSNRERHLMPVTSAPFAVLPAAATHLGFRTQPSTAWEASPIARLTPVVEVAIEDTFENVVGVATSAVTIALGTNSGGGTLSGATTVNAVNGVATFADLGIDRFGSCTLAATAPGLREAATPAFTIAAAPGSLIKSPVTARSPTCRAG
jgi:hypothetical protein